MPLEPKIAINPSSFSPTSLLHTTQDFLIELDMKAYIYLGGFQLVDSKYNGAYTTRDLL